MMVLLFSYFYSVHVSLLYTVYTLTYAMRNLTLSAQQKLNQAPFNIYIHTINRVY